MALTCISLEINLELTAITPPSTTLFYHIETEHIMKIAALTLTVGLGMLVEHRAVYPIGVHQ